LSNFNEGTQQSNVITNVDPEGQDTNARQIRAGPRHVGAYGRANDLTPLKPDIL